MQSHKRNVSPNETSQDNATQLFLLIAVRKVSWQPRKWNPRAAPEKIHRLNVEGQAVLKAELSRCYQKWRGESKMLACDWDEYCVNRSLHHSNCCPIQALLAVLAESL